MHARSSGVPDAQPVMVLPELAGWPSMSIPMAAELPMLAHRRVDSMDGIAHLLPSESCLWLLMNSAPHGVLLESPGRGVLDCEDRLICLFHFVAARAQDVGSANHDGALACAALGPLPACCAVGPPSCAHATFEAGSLSPALSLMHFSSPIGASHTPAGMLPQLCEPPSGPAVAGKAGVHGNAISGLTFAPASQPFVEQVSTAVGSRFFTSRHPVTMHWHVRLCFPAVTGLPTYRSAHCRPCCRTLALASLGWSCCCPVMA